jgi:hypothetical protein
VQLRVGLHHRTVWPRTVTGFGALKKDIYKAMLTCPKCEHPQTCPCEACQGRSPTPKPWVHKGDGYTIACGNCGFEEGADYWQDRSFKQYEEKRKKS